MRRFTTGPCHLQTKFLSYKLFQKSLWWSMQKIIQAPQISDPKWSKTGSKLPQNWLFMEIDENYVSLAD